MKRTKGGPSELRLSVLSYCSGMGSDEKCSTFNPRIKNSMISAIMNLDAINLRSSSDYVCWLK